MGSEGASDRQATELHEEKEVDVDQEYRLKSNLLLGAIQSAMVQAQDNSPQLNMAEIQILKKLKILP